MPKIISVRSARLYSSQLLFVVFIFATHVTLAEADSEWPTGKFTLEQGTVVADSGVSTLLADSSGVVAFILPTSGELLQTNPLITLTLDGQMPQRVIIYWRTQDAGNEVSQTEVAPPVAGSTTYNLSDVPGWQGAVSTLGIALRGVPHQRFNISKVSLWSSSWLDTLTEYFHNWKGHRGWLVSDINFITGTRAFGQTPHLVPYSVGLVAITLVVLAVTHLLWRRAHLLHWKSLGFIVLCVWIISDSFWHGRLWQQAFQTWSIFGGKTTHEKLQASDDAPIVALTQNARQRISRLNARIFIASSSDTVGMLTAYYMSPLNTFWHRGGPELPSGDVFIDGDYILMAQPSEVEYDNGSGIIRRPGKAGLKVREEYRSDDGVLLRVM
jgi:hypothetical protein